MKRKIKTKIALTTILQGVIKKAKEENENKIPSFL
jgi:hypothetical protein